MGLESRIPLFKHSDHVEFEMLIITFNTKHNFSTWNKNCEGSWRVKGGFLNLIFWVKLWNKLSAELNFHLRRGYYCAADKHVHVSDWSQTCLLLILPVHGTYSQHMTPPAQCDFLSFSVWSDMQYISWASCTTGVCIERKLLEDVKKEKMNHSCRMHYDCRYPSLCGLWTKYYSELSRSELKQEEDLQALK